MAYAARRSPWSWLSQFTIWFQLAKIRVRVLLGQGPGDGGRRWSTDSCVGTADLLSWFNYSYCSAVMGSIREARRAGTKHASVATVRRTVDATTTAGM